MRNSAELVDDESAAELGLEPSGLRRHNLSAVSDVHDLLHRDGIEGECHFHLAAIDAALQFTEAAQSADKINTLVRAQILDAEQFVEDET